KSMNDRADELIETITEAEDVPALIQALKDQKHLLFFRIGLMCENLEVLYDSHTKRITRSYVFEPIKKTPLEILKALEMGVGYSEEYSTLLGQKLVYL